MGSHMGSVYKPNSGMYNYGRVQAGDERGRIKQFLAEPVHEMVWKKFCYCMYLVITYDDDGSFPNKSRT